MFLDTHLQMKKVKFRANDKNKKEIYEGDIVRYNDKLTGVVVWKYRGFVLELLNRKKKYNYTMV